MSTIPIKIEFGLKWGDKPHPVLLNACPVGEYDLFEYASDGTEIYRYHFFPNNGKGYCIGKESCEAYLTDSIREWFTDIIGAEREDNAASTSHQSGDSRA